MGAEDRDRFRALLDTHWRAIYNYGLRMCLDRERTAEVIEDVFLRAYIGIDSTPADDKCRPWLLKITQRLLDEKLGRTPEVSFDLLDETLRSEATRTDVVRSLTEPRRDFLLWELKQGCMTSVVNCLSPGERSAFIMSTMMGFTDEESAEILGVTKSAYKVRLSRAKKKITDYLAPRCEHVDPLNPCRCPARVGVALKKGFIRSSGEVNLRKPPQPFGRYGTGGAEDEPLRDIETIYSHLPEPDPPEELYQAILGKVDSGEWDTLLERKRQQG